MSEIKKTTSKNIETRAFSFELRAEAGEEAGIIAGRPIVYNSWTDLGWFNEMIAQDALIGTDLRDVRLLVNHDTSMIPLARSRNNNANSTLRLLVDEEGLSIRARLDIENNAQARSLYSAIERGDISGMSFMFTVDDEEWSDLESEHPSRTIKRIGSVFEVSACTFPAYEETSMDTRDKAALDSARAALDSAKRSLDSDLLQLEKAKAAALLRF